MHAHRFIELFSQDIRVVASERGTLELEGISAEAGAMCGAVLSSIRCSARLISTRCIVELVDGDRRFGPCGAGSEVND